MKRPQNGVPLPRDPASLKGGETRGFVRDASS
jgi:hypothetical protein